MVWLYGSPPLGSTGPPMPLWGPRGRSLAARSWLLASAPASGFGSALVGFRLASLRLSEGFCLGFRLDFGLLLARFGFWLSCTRILTGFDLIWPSAGFRLESALV